MLEFPSYRGAAQPPHRTDTCQCVDGQPWACHYPLQGQVKPLQCEAGMVEPALGAVAGLGWWFVGGAVLPNAGSFQLGDTSGPLQRTEPCQCVSGQPWVCHGPLQGKMKPL